MIDNIRFTELLRKYDVPVPRYTSYPTVPFWDTGKFSTEHWFAAIERSFAESNSKKGISIYIHLPFCESLCTGCTGNTRIARNHTVEYHYIEALRREWDIYKKIFGSVPAIRKIHLGGGGTPTFFSAPNLERLIDIILKDAVVHDEHEFSFEGHPNYSTYEHIKALYDLGFSSVSYSVQDLDEKVQKKINIFQPFSKLKEVTDESRSIGYKSINFDLICALPFQTTATVSDTMHKVLSLKPDRVSLYSCTHISCVGPWQRGDEAVGLPTNAKKRKLYETGRVLLKAHGYEDVGMDHFSLPTDKLFKAALRRTLHRNFMGYTTTPTDLLIGLGASAVSDAKYAYAQNRKTVEAYLNDIANDRLAISTGHVLTQRDMLIGRCILDVACAGNIHCKSLEQFRDADVMTSLYKMQEEGMLTANIDGFHVTELGRAFVHNICAVFDERMNSEKKKESKLFSQAN
ncbi:MAG: oxygen-independent coproporphyrinogen III oxidase [Bacteroidota bacterium]